MARVLAHDVATHEKIEGLVGPTKLEVRLEMPGVAEPRAAGATRTPVPDPYMAAGVVPRGTSAFHDQAAVPADGRKDARDRLGLRLRVQGLPLDPHYA